MDDIQLKIERAKAVRDSLFADLDEPYQNADKGKKPMNVISYGHADDINAQYELIDTIPFRGKTYSVMFTRNNANASLLRIFRTEKTGGNEYLIRETDKNVISYILKLFRERFSDVFIFET